MRALPLSGFDPDGVRIGAFCPDPLTKKKAARA
jgi:hypothetical protein